MESDLSGSPPAYNDCDNGDGSYDYEYEDLEGAEFDGVETTLGEMRVENERTVKQWRRGGGRRLTPRRWIETNLWPDHSDAEGQMTEQAATPVDVQGQHLIRDDVPIASLPLVKEIGDRLEKFGAMEEHMEVDEEGSRSAAAIPERGQEQVERDYFSGNLPQLRAQYRDTALKEFREKKRSGVEPGFGDDPQNGLEAMRADAAAPRRRSKAPVLREANGIATRCANERKTFFRHHVLPALIRRSAQDESGSNAAVLAAVRHSPHIYISLAADQLQRQAMAREDDEDMDYNYEDEDRGIGDTVEAARRTECQAELVDNKNLRRWVHFAVERGLALDDVVQRSMSPSWWWSSTAEVKTRESDISLKEDLKKLRQVDALYRIYKEGKLTLYADTGVEDVVQQLKVWWRRPKTFDEFLKLLESETAVQIASARRRSLPYTVMGVALGLGLG
eukprot:g16975.t1